MAAGSVEAKPGLEEGSHCVGGGSLSAAYWLTSPHPLPCALSDVKYRYNGYERAVARCGVRQNPLAACSFHSSKGLPTCYSLIWRIRASETATGKCYAVPWLTNALGDTVKARRLQEAQVRQAIAREYLPKTTTIGTISRRKIQVECPYISYTTFSFPFSPSHLVSVDLPDQHILHVIFSLRFLTTAKS